jgi:putative hemolysin
VIVSLAAFVVLLAASGILAGLETGLYSLERVRLEVGAAKGDTASRRLLAILSNPASALCAILLATNVAHYVLAHLADGLVHAAAPVGDELTRKILDTALLGPILFVFGDLFPKNLFMKAPVGLMRTFEPVLSALRFVFLPLTKPLVRLAGSRFEGAADRDSLFDRGGIHFLLTADDESAQLTEGQRRLAERVLALRSVRVQDRMIPLRRTSAVPAGATAAEIVAEGARSGHSRLPVFAPDRSRFLGYVNVIDAAAAGPEFGLKEALHELPEFPCDLPVTAALYRLQRAGRPIAAVTGPDGRSVLGIVAVSDIVSALFKV